MRNEKEMIKLILTVAKNDDRIRAVYMNGSKTNSNVPKDIYQDYDIVYVVQETQSFIEDEGWINIFGELLMLQEPDKLDKACGLEVDFTESYAYLMLFADGNRIDLQIKTKECMRKNYLVDSLTIPLLDKDNCLPKIKEPSDIDYWVQRPTQALFDSQCNNFWWCLQNVAKGIKRDELPYVKDMFDHVIRKNLNQIVSWWIGMHHDFKISTGKSGKYFKDMLPKVYWEMYENTYSDGNYYHNWKSLFIACDLFHNLAQDISKNLNLSYNINDEKNMRKFLKQVKNLPHDAKSIF